jgi:5-bromo-4-chloroindolyl phosphate hydrolysis protein
MDNTTPSHKRSLDLLEQLQRSIEQDSYYLTRDDRDQLFYDLERFKNKLNDIYRDRTHG